MRRGQSGLRAQQDRVRLLGVIQARLARFSGGQGPAAVLEPEALADVTALLGTVDDPRADLEVAHAAGWLRWCRHLVLGPDEGEQDRDAAVALLQPVHRAQPEAVPEQVRMLFEKGLPISSDDPRALVFRAATLLDATRQTGDPAALDTAVDLLRKALATTPTDHPDRALMLCNLGMALRIRSERTGRQDDLDSAVEAGRAAVDATWPGHPNRVACLSDLGLALRARYERTGSRDDLEAAVDAGRAAVDVSQPDYPHRAVLLADFGGTLLMRFTRTGSRGDLEEAVDRLRAAVAAGPPDDPDRPPMLSNLGNALQARFIRTGNLADLDEAVDRLREAVRVGPAEHPDRAKWLTNFGIALRARFKRTGNREDLDAAMDAEQAAVGAGSPDLPNQPGRLSNLGGALLARSEWTGDRDDLDKAIERLREAVAGTRPGDPSDAVYRANLSMALRDRFARTGDLADLDAAVEVGQAALAAAPPDHPAYAALLTTLSSTLHTRSQRTGSQADLDMAISLLRGAVNAGPPDHPERAGRLSHLGAVLSVRFERTGKRADLDEAVRFCEAAVNLTPADHPDRVKWLTNLGLALQIRFTRTLDRADLDAAVEAVRAAVAATSPGYPGRAMILSNLARLLQTRFEWAGSLSDLDAAVTAGWKAVKAVAPDHPGSGTYLLNLSAALQARFARTGDQEDLDAAVEAGRAAAMSTASSPHIRAVAARGWGHAAADGKRWAEAVAGFEKAIELLGRVMPRSLTRSDRERLLDELGGMGVEAATCCVHAGRKERAVELFEQGRGVLLGQALDTRTDLTALAEQHPDLAMRFTTLRDDLDHFDHFDHDAGSRVTMATGAGRNGVDDLTDVARHSDDARRRRDAAEAFEQVITDIRRLPGFARFLLSPPVSELTAVAAEGPIVVVNVSLSGSHALILTSGGVLEPVPLIGLTPKTLHKHVVTFLDAIREVSTPARASAEQSLTDTLGWLWDVAAGPVLDRLGITGPPGDGRSWPRLWWCTSGLLSFLPLHAAGHQGTRNDPAPATVIDRVVSSYTPTIRALAYARRARSSGDRGGKGGIGGGRVVAVAMPNTPGAPEAPDLPGAEAEVEQLRCRFRGRVKVLLGPQATHDAVVKELRGARWVHFACHGAVDPGNPSAGQLLLADHQQRPFTVVDVARQRLDDAELAFLSACETARPAERLSDEAIHLSSAFQLAGYRHVIGTLWPIGDQRAVKIAKDIYAAIPGDAGSAGDVARAVHAATRRLRDGWAKYPSVWASHVHSGA